MSSLISADAAAVRTACDPEAGPLFAGIAAYASGLYASQCPSPARIPLLLAQGDADVVVPFAGGYNSINETFPGHVDEVKIWLQMKQCPASPDTTGSFTADGLTVTTKHYDGCTSGASVDDWTILGGALSSRSKVMTNFVTRMLHREPLSIHTGQQHHFPA